ncbi:SCF ubiquitin ligase complex subunit [Collariella sp. IMI 366227]|nr:SCF ubiquitin ligase complex subunit [Collariella sp. IMI 366227]
MRPRAPPDDSSDGQGTPALVNDVEPQTEPARQPQEDSRSTSSTSSPAPPDNEESDFFLGANDSQSSLGVPNIQDMQVVDQECLPPVQRLPNEILIAVFFKLTNLSDLLHVMLTCKRWARNAVDSLWHRPACTTWDKYKIICRTLSLEHPYFAYRDFVRRLNLSALADQVNDGSVVPLASCTRVERLTLTGCSNLTDQGLISLVNNNSHLYSLDVSLGSTSSSSPPEMVFREQITEAAINAISENCPRLQGLNISGCYRVTNESLLKLNDCTQLNDQAVFAFAENCPNILEIDLHQCRSVTNEPVTALFTKGKALRELRLASCELIDDSAFLSLPSGRTYDHLRILDLSSCTRLSDRAVAKIVEVAPRLRNLVLQKCRNLTDAAVYAISKLSKNLHFLHLGHCGNITDDAVKHLVANCNRIRYIDLGCCTNLTDDSVIKLAALPKLKRIGLVKCASITDASVVALANANRRPRMRKDPFGNIVIAEYSTAHSCLERVHLSYCTNLTTDSIIKLLNSCPRLTHLSLTGVQAFLREDLEDFSRAAPREFTDHQRSVFCVFSGPGVVSLRRHFNKLKVAEMAQLAARHPREDPAFFDAAPAPWPGTAIPPPPPIMPALPNTDPALGNGDADPIDDEEGLEDESGMVLDTQPLLSQPNNNPTILGPNPTAPPPGPNFLWSTPYPHPSLLQQLPLHGMPPWHSGHNPAAGSSTNQGTNQPDLSAPAHNVSTAAVSDDAQHDPLPTPVQVLADISSPPGLVVGGGGAPMFLLRNTTTTIYPLPSPPPPPAPPASGSANSAS